MQTPTFEDALRAWETRDAGIDGEERDARPRIQMQAVRALAKGRPLAPEAFAAAAGLSLDRVPAIFARMRETGFEFDDDGSLVGAALTLRPSPHRFRVAGRDLFVWCSLDTLFLPGLLDQPAEVESTCPITGTTIRLHVTSRGIDEYAPRTTVLSVVLPGISCSRDRTGPTSSVCSQMFFFASRDAGEAWVRDRSGVALLTVEEAFELARRRFIEPARRALGEGGRSEPGPSPNVRSR
jgi:alkylmercury lyase